MTRDKIKDFDELFQINPNNTISPKRRIEISGVTLSPGVASGTGVLYGGVSLFTLQGKKILIDEDTDLIRIQGYYEPKN